jgi:hypothetical protein
MMNSITSSKTIRALRSKFVQFGISDRVVSDNGPQLVSEETERFFTTNGIKHVKRSG